MTVAFIFVMGISQVSAAVLTANEIYNILHKKLGDSVQLNNNIITIKETSEYGFEYVMDLKYENNTLTYTNTRDVSQMTQEYRVSYAITDGLMLIGIVYSLFDSYGIEFSDSINEEEFGITIVEGEEISYEGTSDVVVEESEDPDVEVEVSEDSSIDVSMSSTEIKSFSIDMVKFDKAATNYKANSNNTTSKEEVKNEVITDNNTETKKEQVVVKEDTTTEKNPQTGIQNIGIIAIVLASVSLISYIVIRNKKIFVK